MSSVVKRGQLLIHIAENGHSIELDCDECTLVETVQKFLESVSGIPYNDQLLLCCDIKLESQKPLSIYKLPSQSQEDEVYMFNKGRMRANCPPPSPEVIEIVETAEPTSPSSSQNNSHPLDDSPDPALKALPSYDRQFRYHYQKGHAIYSRTQLLYEACERLLRELKVQERALGIARGNVDYFYKIILQNYVHFMKHYSQQHRLHTGLLVNFWRDVEKLRSCKLIPCLQMGNRRCLLDFVKEENLGKMVEGCRSSQMQFDNKVAELKQDFGELKHKTEHLFSSKASFLIRDLELTIMDHQRFLNEQKSIMQALRKDVVMVKKLVDDCLTSQLSSSLRPHDAVSALGPMYDGHDKNYLPKMHSCERVITNLLDYCKAKKDEMNLFVHAYMQKIAYIQFTIKEVRLKFSVFTEALKCQNDQFNHLKVICGIGPAYRACLAEVVRRKASMKLYMGMAGQLVERLATKRDAEVRRREEFLKIHCLYIPSDILASMGLFDTPNHCDVNIAPFDTNLLNIDVSDIEHYAPEHLVGMSSRSEKQRNLKGSFSMSNDSSHSAEVEESSLGPADSDDILEASELVEIAGTSKMEVENAKLKAELASAMARICSFFPEVEYESFGEGKIGSLLKDSAEKTAEALHLKDEYAKRLQSMLKIKQMQCESYEERIRELEQRWSDQYLKGDELSDEKDALSTGIVDDSKSELSGEGEAHMSFRPTEPMDEASCGSNSFHIKLRLLNKQGKEGLDENMMDSSGVLNPQLDSSMLESKCDKVHVNERDGKCTVLADVGPLATSSTADSVSQPPNILPSVTGVDRDMDSKVGDDPMAELQNLLVEKSKQLTEKETKLEALMEEVAKLGRDLEISRKQIDESQMNCGHLENCLHEARKEAQTHLCAADRKASAYAALRSSAVKMSSLIERLRSCVSSSGVAGFAEAFRALTQSLTSSANDDDDDVTAEFRKCMLVLADKVGVLSRHCADLLDKYSKAESANKQLTKDLEEKKELLNTLYVKHQNEKQANKEKISFGRLEVRDIAAFVLNSGGNYEAINRNCPHYYLSTESVALFTDRLLHRPRYIIGQIVHIERQAARPLSPTSGQPEHKSVSTSNPYGVPIGCEYFAVTVAILPDINMHSQPPS